MRIRPLDTSPEAYRVQLEIYKKMSPGQRLQQAINLTQTVRSLNATGVQIRHPAYSEDEVRLAVIRLHLGDELFLKVFPHASAIIP